MKMNLGNQLGIDNAFVINITAYQTLVQVLSADN